MLDFVIQCITFVLRGTTVWRRRSWRSRACSDAKTSAEAQEVDIEGYISPHGRVVRIGSGRSVDRLKVEPLWKEMRKHSHAAGLLAIERASDDRPEAAMDAPRAAISLTPLEAASRHLV